ncbi:Yip1 family protein [Aminipila sp.]|uniref:Yip1 family protein n=1 Tax=Aminipila sp. TaxID=2060095 RepID=UPI0028A2CB4A|nr:Yip1 family protein [Aminipila sp.]
MNNEIQNNNLEVIGEGKQEKQWNPWLSMWTKPRETMRDIINNRPKKYIHILAVIYGIFSSLDKAYLKNMGDELNLWSILLIAVLGGSIGGILYVYINASLIKLTGGWIGGKGSAEEIRAAIVWGSVPYFLVSLLWIPEIILFGEETFSSSTPIIDSSFFLASFMGIAGLIEFIGSMWAIIVGLKCLGEVQGFSAWKALGNQVLAGLIIIVPIIFIVIVFAVGAAIF